jgi:hypothetical protein
MHTVSTTNFPRHGKKRKNNLCTSTNTRLSYIPQYERIAHAIPKVKRGCISSTDIINLYNLQETNHNYRAGSASILPKFTYAKPQTRIPSTQNLNPPKTLKSFALHQDCRKSRGDDRLPNPPPQKSRPS